MKLIYGKPNLTIQNFLELLSVELTTMKVRGFLKDLTLKVEICGRFKTLEYLCLKPVFTTIFS
jgi:hypothetical protein